MAGHIPIYCNLEIVSKKTQYVMIRLVYAGQTAGEKIDVNEKSGNTGFDQ